MFQIIIKSGEWGWTIFFFCFVSQNFESWWRCMELMKRAMKSLSPMMRCSLSRWEPYTFSVTIIMSSWADKWFFFFQSALEMRDKTVQDVMTPIESVYMLEVSGAINRKIVKEVGGWSHLTSLARSSSTPIVALLYEWYFKSFWGWYLVIFCCLYSWLTTAIPGCPSTRALGTISVGYC